MFIKLTSKADDGIERTVYVNADHILSIISDNDKIYIEYSNNTKAEFITDSTQLYVLMEMIRRIDRQ